MATKQQDVIPGSLWLARVSGRIVPVRIERIGRSYISDHWRAEATNTETGRRILIRGAARLRRQLGVPRPINPPALSPPTL